MKHCPELLIGHRTAQKHWWELNDQLVIIGSKERRRSHFICPVIKRNSSGLQMCLPNAGGRITVAVNNFIMVTVLYRGTASQLVVVLEVIMLRNHCRNKVLFKGRTEGGQNDSSCKMCCVKRAMRLLAFYPPEVGFKRRPMPL